MATINSHSIRARLLAQHPTLKDLKVRRQDPYQVDGYDYSVTYTDSVSPGKVKLTLARFLANSGFTCQVLRKVSFEGRQFIYQDFLTSPEGHYFTYLPNGVRKSGFSKQALAYRVQDFYDIP